MNDHELPSSHPAPERVLLAGGSIATGLGVRGNPFGKRLYDGSERRPEVLDLTGSGYMLDGVLGQHRQAVVDFAPDTVVICAGMSERLVHPPAAFQRQLERFAPTTWHGVGGLQPRAYYSTSRSRRLRQRFVSQVKVLLKRAVLRFGSHQRMSLPEFEGHLVALLDLAGDLGSRVVVVGSARVDETLFPGTEKAYRELSDRLAAVAAEREHVRFLDPRAFLDCWDDYVDDNFHWNDSGHDKAARATEALLAAWDVPSEELVVR